MAVELHTVAKTTPLRVLFWLCWAGTVVYFLIMPYPELVFGRTFNPFGDSFVCGLVMALCFTSAFCVRRQPRLALIGALTLALPIVMMLMVILINVIFHWVTGNA